MEIHFRRIAGRWLSLPCEKKRNIKRRRSFQPTTNKWRPERINHRDYLFSTLSRKIYNAVKGRWLTACFSIVSTTSLTFFTVKEISISERYIFGQNQLKICFFCLIKRRQMTIFPGDVRRSRHKCSHSDWTNLKWNLLLIWSVTQHVVDPLCWFLSFRNLDWKSKSSTEPFTSPFCVFFSWELHKQSFYVNKILSLRGK